MDFPTHELPLPRETAGAPYAWAPWATSKCPELEFAAASGCEVAGVPYGWPLAGWPPSAALESSGCPYHELVQRTAGMIAGCPNLAIASSADLAIAGAVFAGQMGHNYEAIAGYLDARVGELVAGYSPWEEGITGSFFGNIARSVS